MAPPQPIGVVPHLYSPEGLKHVEWLKAVFGAEVKQLVFKDKSNEKVLHCLLAINGGFLYLFDGDCANPDSAPEQQQPPEVEAKPRGFLCHLELAEPRAAWDRAMSHGCTTVMELKVQFWGSLYGTFRDPFGFTWSVMQAGDNPAPGVVPSIVTPDGECEKHIDWLKTALGAEVKSTYHTDDGKIMHCSVALNGGVVYLSDRLPGTGDETPGKPYGMVLHMYQSDPKPMWAAAHENGAQTNMELKMQFWGELYGSFKDTFGYEWSLAQKTVTPTRRRTGVIPYLLSPDCAKHVEWIKSVFAGELKEQFYSDDTKTKIMHCAVELNDGVIYLANASCSSEHTEGDPRGFLCHVESPDPHLIWKKAQASGATVIMEYKKQFWGDEYGSFRDPFGFSWGLTPAPTD